jgi:hypothetical protein
MKARGARLDRYYSKTPPLGFRRMPACASRHGVQLRESFFDRVQSELDILIRVS